MCKPVDLIGHESRGYVTGEAPTLPPLPLVLSRYLLMLSCFFFCFHALIFALPAKLRLCSGSCCDSIRLHELASPVKLYGKANNSAEWRSFVLP